MKTAFGKQKVKLDLLTNLKNIWLNIQEDKIKKIDTIYKKNYKMRAIIQRCKNANLYIEGKIYSEIKTGLLVLLGITHDDTQSDIEWLSGKISRLRIFNDENDKMNLSVKDIEGEIMVVSQFTLYASTKKGNRPSYINSAPPDIAIPLYEKFIECLKKDSGLTVVTGKFGAFMEIDFINDGPVTIIIDTKNKE